MATIATTITVTVAGRAYEAVPGRQLYEDILMNDAWEDQYRRGVNLRMMISELNNGPTNVTVSVSVGAK